jgi:acyl-homoserine-lactone acylase
MKYLLVLALVLCSIISNAQIDPKDVTIVRDQWGVPHIFGKTDADVAYGLAWANAEDSFEMIQEDYLNIKHLNGRIKGIEGAKIDYVLALLKSREIALQKYETELSPEFKKYVKAYVEGFNAYAATHPDQIICKGIFPIDEIDIVSGYIISFAFMSRLEKELMTLFKGEDYEQSYIGSNGIALNSAKTTDGSVYLDINSHQTLEGIMSWYEAHLVSEEGMNIYGGLLHGGATIFHGANENLGWAHTDNNFDLIDIYKLDINPKNPNQYMFDGKWEYLEISQVKLKIKIGGIVIPVRKKAYWSKYGATLKTKKGMFSIRLAANMDVRGAEQWYWMNKAQNFTQFKKALEMQALPCFNIIYADRFDTIYHLSNAMVPFRDTSYNWKGILPGNTSKTLWTDLHPLIDLPQTLNPSCGFVFNTNNSPFDASCLRNNQNCDNTMCIKDNSNNRSLRFHELIEEKEKFSYDDFKKLKYDLAYPDSILPIFNISLSEIFKMKIDDYPEFREELKLIQQWDKKSDTNNVGATLVFLTGYYLQQLAKQGDKVYRADYNYRKNCYEKALRNAKNHLAKYFGTSNVQWGQLQRHIRGEKNIAVPGMPDVIASMYSLAQKDGRFKSFAGESYIQLVRFSKEGTHIETINAYGSSNHPNSPHYNDQMELFVKQKTKEVSLDKEIIFNQAEKIYHPGLEF